MERGNWRYFLRMIDHVSVLELVCFFVFECEESKSGSTVGMVAKTVPHMQSDGLNAISGLIRSAYPFYLSILQHRAKMACVW